MMKPPTAQDTDEFIKLMLSGGHNRTVGLTPHAHGDDWIELAMPYDASFASDAESGILASGPIFTLMDMSATIAIWLKLGAPQPQATLDLRVDYLRPATPGKTVYGKVEAYRMTKSVAFVRGSAHDGDAAKPLANVAGTYVFTSPK